MMRKTVLVCDDEPAIRESVSFIVSQEGYEALTAEDGDEGLRVLRGSEPQLVLLDVMMPGRTGFELCREIKAADATRNTYVILLTAAGQERDRADGYESGADEYMTKPFSPRMLRQKLHEVLDVSP
jgi:DNA-binding response OmpR family regulator